MTWCGIKKRPENHRKGCHESNLATKFGATVMMMDANTAEANRRIRQAANLIASAIRLGADARDVVAAVRSAVAEGAEQYAADVIEDYDKAVA